jgi:hypothetical protein
MSSNPGIQISLNPNCNCHHEINGVIVRTANCRTKPNCCFKCMIVKPRTLNPDVRNSDRWSGDCLPQADRWWTAASSTRSQGRCRRVIIPVEVVRDGVFIISRRGLTGLTVVSLEQGIFVVARREFRERLIRIRYPI